MLWVGYIAAMCSSWALMANAWQMLTFPKKFVNSNNKNSIELPAQSIVDIHIVASDTGSYGIWFSDIHCDSAKLLDAINLTAVNVTKAKTMVPVSLMTPSKRSMAMFICVSPPDGKIADLNAVWIK
jgi:hypothetical protein